MYARIHVDILHFNKDTKQSSDRCQNPEKKAQSQLSSALTNVQVKMCWIRPHPVSWLRYTPFPLQIIYYCLSSISFHFCLNVFSIQVSLHTVHHTPHTQVLARCPKLNNRKGSCLVSVLDIPQHWWNQEQRFGENPDLPNAVVTSEIKLK